MCVQNFSYFNGNFLPGVFPGPQVFVAFTADIPEARKGPDSFNKPFSVHYTNELQCPMGFVASLYDAGIELQSILAIGSDAMRYVLCDTFCSSQYTQLVATRFNATRCDALCILWTSLYSLNWTLTKSPVEFFNQFNHFNDGSDDYVIQKAVTKTIRMLSV